MSTNKTTAKPAIPALLRVKSSSVAEIGHAGDQLFVRFTGGGKLYRYDGITPERYAAVRDAKSVGRALQSEILAGTKGVPVDET